MKVLTNPEAAQELGRRELAALRALELPGVVNLLDEGLWLTPSGERRACLVLELVEGPPFPLGPLPWDALEGPTLALLHTLRTLHGAGLVHRDLKPEHVRIQRDGSVVLLDLGLATGVGAGVYRPGARMEVGTPLYMAPEQFLDAERADPRADLYAVGLLLFQALTGVPAHPGPDRQSYKRQRLSGRPIPLRALAPSVPEAVEAVVLSLLSRQVAARPESADRVLQVLGAATDLAVDRALEGLGPRPLEALFVGPSILFHLPEDAARCLRERAGEERQAQAVELSAWLRTGRACWRGQQLEVGRTALRAMRSSDAQSALATRLREGDWGGAAQLAMAQGDAAWLRGDLEGALACVDQGLVAARAGQLPEAEVALLTERVRVSIGMDLGALRRTMYELDRAGSSRLPDLRALCKAAECSRGGQGDSADLGALPRFDDERLDRWRLALAVERAQHGQDLGALSAAVRAGWIWARERGSAEAEADVWNWEGLLLRRRLDFEGAARAHGRAALGKAHVSGRLSARLNQADALLEHADLDGAQRAALAVAEEAAPLRLLLYEGRALRVLRAAAYRLGRPAPEEPDLELAAERLGDVLAGELLFTEAASAWWRRDKPHARDLALRAARRWERRDERVLPLLALSLAEVCDTEPQIERAWELVHALLPCEQPGLKLQALGVLGLVFPTLHSRVLPELEQLSARLPVDLARGRRELLTVAEALAGRLQPR